VFSVLYQATFQTLNMFSSSSFLLIRGAAQLTTFARDIPDSLRRKDTKRSEKRLTDKERKALEKEKKKEELKRLKNLKKKEILDKLKQVEHVSGASALGFEHVDLEGDFDPEEHDRKMQELFNDEYYHKNVRHSTAFFSSSF
jgi:protein KRI1